MEGSATFAAVFERGNGRIGAAFSLMSYRLFCDRNYIKCRFAVFYLRLSVEVTLILS